MKSQQAKQKIICNKNVLDNITLETVPTRSIQRLASSHLPFEYNGITYSPKYNNGQIQRYDGQLKNLRIFFYPQKIYLKNSLHKFYHGNNYGDFHLKENVSAIENLNDSTGFNWFSATVKNVEYGCNVETNPNLVINSILSYKGKDYQPMAKHGFKYGVTCDFMEHRIKGYNKTYEVSTTDKIKLQQSIFRWEIKISNMRCLANKLPIPLLVNQLIRLESFEILASDAISKFNNSIRMQKLHLFKLTAHEKLVVAALMNKEIVEDLKVHHKEAYKKYKKLYKQIMGDKSICVVDSTGDDLAEKFNKLIY